MASRKSTGEAVDSPEALLTPSDPHGTERLLRAEEVAKLLGVPRSWVYERTRQGRIPHVRLGRYYRYRLSSLVAWLEMLERDSDA